MKYILSMTLIIFYSAVYAQELEKQKLSLNEALELARSNNFDLQASLADVVLAKGQLKSANAAFFPSVELSENYVNTNDPLNVFGLKLKQGTVTNSDFNPELLNSPESIENFNTRITVEQPIINLDAFSQKSAMKNFYDASQMSHQRKLQYISYITKQSYYGLLLSASHREVAQKSLKTAEEGYNVASDNFKAGYILQSDLLAAEVRMLSAKNQVKSAEAEYFNALQQLKYLTGIDGDANIGLIDTLSLPDSFVVLKDSLLVDESRSDINALQEMSKGQKKVLHAYKYQYLPNLNAFFGYEWNDEVAFGNNSDNYLLGISLKWKLFDGFRREAEIQKSKSQWDKSQITKEKAIAQANIELRNALKQLEISFEQINTYQIATERAEKLYKIKMDRYKVGLEKTADIIDAEGNAYQQKIALQNALYQYYTSIFKIEYLVEKEII